MQTAYDGLMWMKGWGAVGFLCLFVAGAGRTLCCLHKNRASANTKWKHNTRVLTILHSTHVLNTIIEKYVVGIMEMLLAVLMWD